MTAKENFNHIDSGCGCEALSLSLKEEQISRF
jgi:hypothetical protein